MVNDIAFRLVEAARCGDGVVLDEIDRVNPLHLKYVLAAVAKVAAESTHSHIDGTSAGSDTLAEADELAAVPMTIGPAGIWSSVD
jgi:hypothetical protein